MPGGQGSSHREGNPGAEGDTSEEKQQRGLRGGSEGAQRGLGGEAVPRGGSSLAPGPGACLLPLPLPRFDPPPASVDAGPALSSLASTHFLLLLQNLSPPAGPVRVSWGCWDQ